MRKPEGILKDQRISGRGLKFLNSQTNESGVELLTWVEVLCTLSERVPKVASKRASVGSWWSRNLGTVTCTRAAELLLDTQIEQ